MIKEGQQIQIKHNDFGEAALKTQAWNPKFGNHLYKVQWKHQTCELKVWNIGVHLMTI